MAWGTYMLRKFVCVGFHWFLVLARAQCLWLIGGPGVGFPRRGVIQHPEKKVKYHAIEPKI
jgi:hypothetical protein